MYDTVTVYDDEGNEIELYVIEETQLNGDTYLLASEDDYADESDAWILKQIRTDDDSVYYEMIDDEDELGAVAEVFGELLDDDFDINL